MQNQSPRTLARPTFALYTLGCKVNQYDSHQIARMLVARGFRRVEFKEVADLYVIDTCTVTAEADKKSRKAAARAQRNNPDALVAVTGCAATKDALQFQKAAPGALVLSNAQKFELPERAITRLQTLEAWASNYHRWREEMASEPIPSPTRERAVLKIQDGCNHKCSYCIIPSVRGASVVKSRAQLMVEARSFVSEGARELVVTGVSMGDWGTSESGARDPQSGERRAPNADMCELLRALTTIKGLERIRTSSLDPADVDEEWLQTVANTPGLMPHIHLALQSGSASVLRRMRRRYTPALYLKWAKLWRELNPDAGLTTDVIVGFPGETEEEWQETLETCRAAQFSAIHVFPYSPREGTFAAQHLEELGGLVPSHIQNRRVDELLALSAQQSQQFASRFLGRDNEILVEAGGKPGFAEGLTPAYLKARIALNGRAVQIGDILRFRATDWRDGTFIGEAL